MKASLAIALSAAAAVTVATPLSAAKRAACPATPSTANFSDTKLTNPFVFADGTSVTTKEDWACRAAELSALLQDNELGVIPPPPTSLTSALSGNKLTITASNGAPSISFTVTLNMPAGATATSPVPAVIAFGGLSIPLPAGVASIIFDNSGFGEQNDQSSRGVGLFFDLFGSDASAGAMSAWAWGVSRIIDALEQTPESGVDLSRLGVTGCSRNGKGALVAGAFDPRLALVIPQESGSGGAGCWRISDAMFADGVVTQTASEIVQENVWFGLAFNAFANNVTALPVDHHFLPALVAPRGLFVIENTFFDWLGPLSTFGCMSTGQTAFTALGVTDNMGYKAVNHSDHCAFPAAIQPQLTAFFDKFFFGQDTDTSVFSTDGGFIFDKDEWITWETPTLSGSLVQEI
ncbi:hypothetical protein EXIGLDRAFT_680237 [Exidia glandulosa HHB12029]|uniref:(4-O-methyl)-D-glucuronate--lignin esterase n=1 Tax=Exidia glandulosa HHB12029 TaxID=1314781 RepID=A0A165EJX5_EXIGL|nr:hypothetical protein EXIGLDRAFT_680237 [Exidia glandulosa HHB12029]